jgi:hypothetical protein
MLPEGAESQTLSIQEVLDGDDMATFISVDGSVLEDVL